MVPCHLTFKMRLQQNSIVCSGQVPRNNVNMEIWGRSIPRKMKIGNPLTLKLSKCMQVYVHLHGTPNILKNKKNNFCF